METHEFSIISKAIQTSESAIQHTSEPRLGDFSG